MYKIHANVLLGKLKQLRQSFQIHFMKTGITVL